MTPVKTSLPEEREISTYLIADRTDHKVGTPDPESRCPETNFVRCFRHEGEDYPRCDRSGLRPPVKCASCGVPAGRPSQGDKALSAERGAKSWEKLRSLPLYCMDCNPRFFKAGLALFKDRGS
jgi:5-methylcytosine-specific restriction endonuclease McrA